ncbi:MAG: hypothetical protein V4550_14150 [Gemmatimonadota bacterium]
MADKPKRVREQAVVYLDERDSALLDAVAQKTGLAKTELFRRGLRRLAEEMLSGPKAGSSLAYLIATATDDAPSDIAERHDFYLYGGGYEALKKGKRARPR